MRLVEVAYITSTKLEDSLTIQGGHCASITELEIVDDGVRVSACGFGHDQQRARQDLAAKLSWSNVKVGHGEHRREFCLPEVVI